MNDFDIDRPHIMGGQGRSGEELQDDTCAWAVLLGMMIGLAVLFVASIAILAALAAGKDLPWT